MKILHPQFFAMAIIDCSTYSYQEGQCWPSSLDCNIWQFFLLIFLQSRRHKRKLQDLNNLFDCKKRLKIAPDNIVETTAQIVLPSNIWICPSLKKVSVGKWLIPNDLASLLSLILTNSTLYLSASSSIVSSSINALSQARHPRENLFYKN